MLVSIGSYSLCNGTLAGGVAVSELRLKADRLFEFIIPIGDVDSTLLDRINTTFDATFTVKRTHSSVHNAEKFILQLDSNIPISGTITFETTGPGAFTRVIPRGFVIDHALLQENGATTFHQYHVIGGAPVIP